jgi:hypothetical protein
LDTRVQGRGIAAEIEKYFETKVKPETIRKKAGRMAGTNVPQGETATNPASSAGEEKKQGEEERPICSVGGCAD